MKKFILALALALRRGRGHSASAGPYARKTWDTPHQQLWLRWLSSLVA